MDQWRRKAIKFNWPHCGLLLNCSPAPFWIPLGLLLLLVAPTFAQTTVVQIDPTITHGTWQGWGTSLCWWGKAFGDRDDLADLIFTTKTVQVYGHNLPGLGLNIARYNAGACSWNDIDGKKMVVSRTILPFRQMEGYWLDGKSDDPSSASWNWNVDANQRAMLQKARDRGATRFELFSNSPMWWMCVNDNPSGSPDGKIDNLDPAYADKFAIYLATIAKYARENWGITFTTVEPFNEPASSSWSANGRQEGCHFSHKMQAFVLPLLRQEMDKRGLSEMPISASDESLYDQAVATWQSFTPQTKSLINQVNVHGYQSGGGRRDTLFRIVSRDGKPLWNSEYGDDDGSGLKLAANLDLDFRYLHPVAWNYWQPFDNAGWGWIITDMVNRKFLGTNAKLYVIAQYTRHILPGMIILETGDTRTVAAYDPKNHKLVLVVLSTRPISKTIDLGKFAAVGGPVSSWFTQPSGFARYVRHDNVPLRGKRLEITMPPDSVQTFEIANTIAALP